MDRLRAGFITVLGTLTQYGGAIPSQYLLCYIYSHHDLKDVALQSLSIYYLSFTLTYFKYPNFFRRYRQSQLLFFGGMFQIILVVSWASVLTVAGGHYRKMQGLVLYLELVVVSLLGGVGAAMNRATRISAIDLIFPRNSVYPENGLIHLALMAGTQVLGVTMVIPGALFFSETNLLLLSACMSLFGCIIYLFLRMPTSQPRQHEIFTPVAQHEHIDDEELVETDLNYRRHDDKVEEFVDHYIPRLDLRTFVSPMLLSISVGINFSFFIVFLPETKVMGIEELSDSQVLSVICSLLLPCVATLFAGIGLAGCLANRVTYRVMIAISGLIPAAILILGNYVTSRPVSRTKRDEDRNHKQNI
mmetsp:Transcript_25302/g.28948  ORF Transcript_25302/g.28948 Transcript_25302/m.28948 type:complete len:360 (-) Transcript_25302:1798-2877(-)